MKKFEVIIHLDPLYIEVEADDDLEALEKAYTFACESYNIIDVLDCDSSQCVEKERK